MSELLTGVVISHGDVAAALVDAVRQITGENGMLVAVSNRGCSGEALRHLVEQAVESEPAVVFVDMPAGSCLQATVAGFRDRPRVRVVAGVNLPMLLDFVYHRDVSADEAAERAVTAGGRAIRAFPT